MSVKGQPQAINATNSEVKRDHSGLAREKQKTQQLEREVGLENRKEKAKESQRGSMNKE